jgi:hypothetical protein
LALVSLSAWLTILQAAVKRHTGRSSKILNLSPGKGRPGRVYQIHHYHAFLEQGGTRPRVFTRKHQGRVYGAPSPGERSIRGPSGEDISVRAECSWKKNHHVQRNETLAGTAILLHHGDGAAVWMPCQSAMRQGHEKIYYDTTFEYNSTDKNKKKRAKGPFLRWKRRFLQARRS